MSDSHHYTCRRCGTRFGIGGHYSWDCDAALLRLAGRLARSAERTSTSTAKDRPATLGVLMHDAMIVKMGVGR